MDVIRSTVEGQETQIVPQKLGVYNYWNDDSSSKSAIFPQSPQNC